MQHFVCSQVQCTHSRHVLCSPIPQMTCVGGDACRAFQPQTVQCRNMGSDGFDVQWKCEADMSTEYRFGTTTVSCEGYDSPGVWHSPLCMFAFPRRVSHYAVVGGCAVDWFR